jgi:hypothetical protein
MQAHRRLLSLDNQLRELPRPGKLTMELPFDAGGANPDDDAAHRYGARNHRTTWGHPAPLAARVPLVRRDTRDRAGHQTSSAQPGLSTGPTEIDNRRPNRPAVAGQPLGEGATGNEWVVKTLEPLSR